MSNMIAASSNKNHARAHMPRVQPPPSAKNGSKSKPAARRAFEGSTGTPLHAPYTSVSARAEGKPPLAPKPRQQHIIEHKQVRPARQPASATTNSDSATSNPADTLLAEKIAVAKNAAPTQMSADTANFSAHCVEAVKMATAMSATLDELQDAEHSGNAAGPSRHVKKSLVDLAYLFNVHTSAKEVQSAAAAQHIPVQADQWAEATDRLLHEYQSLPQATPGRACSHQLAVMVHGNASLVRWLCCSVALAACSAAFLILL